MSRLLQAMTDMEIKTAVAKRYSMVASQPEAKFNFPVGKSFAISVGYPENILNQLPPSLWESFTGAGNPQPFVDIIPGESILDLGCGAGLDLYFYAQATGPSGRVYGLDLSSEMIAKAERNMKLMQMNQVKLFWSSADCIPLPDESVDLVSANGIYNLSPDKDQVMKEVYRALRPGGRTIFAEIVLSASLPHKNQDDIEDWFRCIGGALVKEDFLKKLESNGFSHTRTLSLGRNARTGHPLALCAVIRAEKEHKNAPSV